MKTVTCNGCRFNGDCDHQRFLRSSLRGYGITALKFVCALRESVFSPGQPVIFTTYLTDEDEAHRGGRIEVRYPGYCVEQRGTKVLGFIKPGEAEHTGDDRPFETHGAGFVKIPAFRVAADETREPISLRPCNWCGGYADFGPCGKDPHYTPKGSCARDGEVPT